MRKPYFCAVVGKNFGDEGKGLAVDFLSDVPGKVLVIRHNGGAQSGHTVERPDKRFIFHELSSASFRKGDTFWADTYFPDLYKLGEEMEAFDALTGFMPEIYADINARITIIDDVLLNMAAESARGNHRHGSCGMGIYEAKCRSEAGFAVTIKDLLEWSEVECVDRLREIRRVYLPHRIQELREELPEQRKEFTPQDNMQQSMETAEVLRSVPEEYAELLQSDTVLVNAVKEIYRNLQYVKPISDVASFLQNYDRVIFENGQGLLLDTDNAEYSPHVTASRTGLTNSCEFLNRYQYALDEVVYVTRSYVTRHGAGFLPGECSRAELKICEEDQTNLDNPWQGSLRYARHESIEKFIGPVAEDLQSLKKYNMPSPVCSLMITHLNETANCVLTKEVNYNIEEFCKLMPVKEIFKQFYLSDSRYAKDIKIVK